MLSLLDMLIYESIECHEADLIQVSGVTFTKDFGPWKAGYRCNIIAMTEESGGIYLQEWTDRPVQQCKVSLTPS